VDFFQIKPPLKAVRVYALEAAPVYMVLVLATGCGAGSDAPETSPYGATTTSAVGDGSGSGTIGGSGSEMNSVGGALGVTSSAAATGTSVGNGGAATSGGVSANTTGVATTTGASGVTSTTSTGGAGITSTTGPDTTGTTGATSTSGSGGEVVWPNEMSQANSDDWLSENHDRITQLRPKVLVINLESSTTTEQAETLVDQHTLALKEASSFHKYNDMTSEPAVAYELSKIVHADKGSRIDYNSWNTQPFADSVLQIPDPAEPSGPNLTLCELFEKGVINEVWCMASSDPKCGETQEAKQIYNADGTKDTGRFAHASNGDNITGLGCGVTVRITDFNSGRGAGCHLHAMGHAWERYMDSNAVPMLRKQAARFLNWDLDTRVGAPFSNFYGACNSNGSLLTDCMVWDSEIHMRSGPSASTSFDIADMSAGCGNTHFYPNTTGTYSYDANSPDPTVQSSCENYGMHNGPDGKDLTTPYSNAMTDMFYGRSQRTCPAEQPACDDDCGGHGTTYLYQNFPGPGTIATNADGTPMHNWWVYLFY
jgi:hypothetical protein